MDSKSKTKIIEMANGMSREEMELMVSQFPIDICLHRINNEIVRLRAFENTIVNAIDKFDTSRE